MSGRRTISPGHPSHSRISISNHSTSCHPPDLNPAFSNLPTVLNPIARWKDSLGPLGTVTHANTRTTPCILRMVISASYNLRPMPDPRQPGSTYTDSSVLQS